MKKALIIVYFSVEVDNVPQKELDECSYKTPKNWKKLIEDEFKADVLWSEKHPFYTVSVTVKSGIIKQEK